MLDLKTIKSEETRQWEGDFQAKSKAGEQAPQTAEYLGIFNNNVLVGYFAFTGYTDRVIQIHQGYLAPEHRHFRLHKLALGLFQKKAKKCGFKKISLTTSRALRAYTSFMTDMNYKPETITFSKEL